MSLTRRSWLQSVGVTSSIGAAAGRRGGQTPQSHRPRHDNHAMGLVGRITNDQLSPTRYLRTWNFRISSRIGGRSTTARRSGPTGRCSGSTRSSRSIERSRSRPGCSFPPGPITARFRGRRSARPKAIGQESRSGTRGTSTHDALSWLASAGDGRRAPRAGSAPGESFVYEFDADPFGLHLYHCHTVPLKRHIHKGLYGAFIIDPAEAAAGGRTGDGDERVRHELRRGQRGLRRQHDREHVRAGADTRHGRTPRASI